MHFYGLIYLSMELYDAIRHYLERKVRQILMASSEMNSRFKMSHFEG